MKKIEKVQTENIQIRFMCLRVKLTFSLSLASLATVDPYREEKLEHVKAYHNRRLV